MVGVTTIFVMLVHAVLGQGIGDLPTSCRTVVNPAATNPLQCVMVTRTALGISGLELDPAWQQTAQLSADAQTDTTNNQDSFYNDLLKQWVNNPAASDGTNPSVADAAKQLLPDSLPGACRWDLERSNRLGNAEACLCPATQTTCEINRKGCYWYKIPPVGGLEPTFSCINTAERFYYLLAKLLRKRGKKDFAIKIRYGATPARGQLPLGPYGPALIGGGSQNAMMRAMQQVQSLQSSRPGFGQFMGGAPGGGSQGPSQGGFGGQMAQFQQMQAQLAGGMGQQQSPLGGMHGQQNLGMLQNPYAAQIGQQMGQQQPQFGQQMGQQQPQAGQMFGQQQPQAGLMNPYAAQMGQQMGQQQPQFGQQMGQQQPQPGQMFGQQMQQPQDGMMNPYAAQMGQQQPQAGQMFGQQNFGAAPAEDATTASPAEAQMGWNPYAQMGQSPSPYGQNPQYGQSPPQYGQNPYQPQPQPYPQPHWK